MLYSNWTFAHLCSQLSMSQSRLEGSKRRQNGTRSNQLPARQRDGSPHADPGRTSHGHGRPPWSAVHHWTCNSAPGTQPANSVFHWSCHPHPGMLHGSAWCNVHFWSVWLHRNYALQNHITPCEWSGMKCNTNVRSSESYSGSFMSLETIETKLKQLLNTLKDIEHAMKIAWIGPCPARGASHSNWPWRFPHHNCHNCTNCHNFESRKVQVPRCSELHSWKQHVNFSGTVQSRI